MRTMNPTLECLTALSVIFDIANGFAEDKSLLTAAFGLELAREAGGEPAEQSAVFLASLLRHLGCTAHASVEATLATDDIRLRSRAIQSDASRPLDLVAAVVASNEGLVERSVGLLRLATHGSEILGSLAREACGAARLLADQLRLGPAVVRALDEVFERWDGTGAPNARAGEEISRVARIAQVAHTAVLSLLTGGPALATGTLRHRAGKTLDPYFADLAIGSLPRLEEAAADPLAVRVVAARVIEATPLAASTEDIAVAFGDFADLQAPYTRGHSRTVARVAEEAARRLGVPAAECHELRLAAHLHDLGSVAVPTSVWTRARPFRPSEQERARSHVYHTERILASAAPLAGVARMAGAHHERLDGSGYHRGTNGVGIPRAARLLAAADVMCAMQEPRPHRPARRRSDAARELRKMAADGALDPSAVEAVLATLSEPGAAVPAAVASLTARETDVLRKLARGMTNKEIAAALDISDRTVQHHTIHIYGKLGVDTRAGATLLAARNGLLEPV